MEAAPDCEFVPSMAIENIYKIKSPAEIELIRKAERAAIAGIEGGFAAVGVGVREYDFAVACGERHARIR